MTMYICVVQAIRIAIGLIENMRVVIGIASDCARVTSSIMLVGVGTKKFFSFVFGSMKG